MLKNKMINIKMIDKIAVPANCKRITVHDFITYMWAKETFYVSVYTKFDYEFNSCFFEIGNDDTCYNKWRHLVRKYYEI